MVCDDSSGAERVMQIDNDNTPLSIPSSQAGHDGPLIGSEDSRTPQMSTHAAGPRFAGWRIKTRDCAILKRLQCLDFRPGQGAVQCLASSSSASIPNAEAVPLGKWASSAARPFTVPTCIAMDWHFDDKPKSGTVRYGAW